MIALACERAPLLVPVAMTVWGVLCWFGGFRNYFRDPRAEIQKVAELRANSIFRMSFRPGNVEREFRWLWRFRWFTYAVIIAWVPSTIWTWVSALFCTGAGA